MAVQHKVKLLFLSWPSILLLASGARIGVRSLIDTSADSSERIGPDGEPWIKDSKYVCMQKWQDSGSFSSGGKFVDKFCLANFDRAREIASNHFQTSELSRCQSSSDGNKMKVCALKGERPEGRLSYATKKHISKACFRHTTSQEVLEAAVDEAGCEPFQTPSPDQAQSFRAAITTTTTRITTTLTLTEMEDELVQVIDDHFEAPIECNCDDGLVGEITGNECTCTPARCGLLGTIGDGPSCQCMKGLSGDITWSGATPNGQCIYEAKALFTVGYRYPLIATEEMYWEYEGKAIKCCTSSAGKPTKLQNMNAAELPSKGSFGRSAATGCGYMFGDTYHNGMGGYKGAAPACSVSIAEIMEVTGEHFDVVKDFLNLEGA